jgi:hypothetical protein
MTYATLVTNITSTWYNNFKRLITGIIAQTSILEIVAYFELDKNSANVFKITGTGAQTIVMPANSRLLNVFIETLTLVPTCKIGTTAGAEDLSPDMLVGSGIDWGGLRSLAGQTIYITIGGTGTVNIRYELKTIYMP